MNLTDRRQRFRAILEGDRCVHPGSVFDPISARIAEDLGFEVGMFAGSIATSRPSWFCDAAPVSASRASTTYCAVVKP